MAKYSCFNCDHLGGAFYQEHQGFTHWFIGHWDGEGHYACEACAPLLHEPRPLPQDEEDIKESCIWALKEAANEKIPFNFYVLPRNDDIRVMGGLDEFVFRTTGECRA